MDIQNVLQKIHVLKVWGHIFLGINWFWGSTGQPFFPKEDYMHISCFGGDLKQSLFPFLIWNNDPHLARFLFGVAVVQAPTPRPARQKWVGQIQNNFVDCEHPKSVQIIQVIYVHE